ncbi:MAG TPA: hypothetical protein VFE62_23735 [Gemmataceae bacterium]|nr:hypothetical protein [Pirellulales bacterium]HZZ81534.1 hypothetical protein [Gemmataceae bacterium]
MSTASKSPQRVIKTAYLVGQLALPDYAHLFSPKKFTQPQLFACLALKEFLQLDYRKLAALLADCSDLRAAIELAVVPHFTTFQKAAQRPLRLPLAEALVQVDDGPSRPSRVRSSVAFVRVSLVRPKEDAGMNDDLLHEQLAYYRARAAEYDQWFQQTTRRLTQG